MRLPQQPSRPSWSSRSVLGLLLLVVSSVLWLAVLALPFLPLSLSSAAMLAGGLFVAGELLFWLGVLVVGPEMMRWLWRWVPWRRRRLGGPAARPERPRDPSSSRSPT
jgi:hypothetical protein